MIKVLVYSVKWLKMSLIALKMKELSCVLNGAKHNRWQNLIISRLNLR